MLSCKVFAQLVAVDRFFSPLAPIAGMRSILQTIYNEYLKIFKQFSASKVFFSGIDRRSLR